MGCRYPSFCWKVSSQVCTGLYRQRVVQVWGIDLHVGKSLALAQARRNDAIPLVPAAEGSLILGKAEDQTTYQAHHKLSS